MLIVLMCFDFTANELENDTCTSVIVTQQWQSC